MFVHECLIEDSLNFAAPKITISKIIVMAFSTTAIQPVTPPVHEKPANSDVLSSLLGALMLSVYAAQKSKKAMRKMQRRMIWSALKLKVKSLFSKKAVSDRVLIYILLGIIALVLVFYYPLVALIVALIALILILAHVI